MRAISGRADRPTVCDHSRNGSACLIDEIQNWSSHRHRLIKPLRNTQIIAILHPTATSMLHSSGAGTTTE
jgi:hypothetical protein